MALSRDKFLLAAGGNPAIRIYDTVAATRNSAPPSSDAVGNVDEAVAGTAAAAPNNALASPSTVVTATEPPLRVLEGHRGNVTALGFHPTGRWLWSVGEDCTLRIWQREEAKGPAGFECLREISLRHPISCAALAGDELLFLGDAKGRISAWDVKKFVPLLEVAADEQSSAPLRSVSVSADGRLVASIDQAARLALWLVDRTSSTTSLPTCLRLRRLAGIEAHPGAYATKCLFSPDGRAVLTTSADGLAKLWRIVLPHHRSAESLPLSAPPTTSTTRNDGGDDCGDEDGAFLLPPLGGPIDRTLALGDEVRLELDQVFSGHSKWVWDCAFSADSAYIVTASSDNTARLWDAATAETIAIYSGHTKALTGLALNDLPLDHDLPAPAS